MSEQPLSASVGASAVSPAVFLVIFCRGDVATYGESGNMADHIWSGPDRAGLLGRKKKRSANVFKMEKEGGDKKPECLVKWRSKEHFSLLRRNSLTTR